MNDDIKTKEFKVTFDKKYFRPPSVIDTLGQLQMEMDIANYKAQVELAKAQEKGIIEDALSKRMEEIKSGPRPIDVTDEDWDTYCKEKVFGTPGGISIDINELPELPAQKVLEMYKSIGIMMVQPRRFGMTYKSGL